MRNNLRVTTFELKWIEVKWREIKSFDWGESHKNCHKNGEKREKCEFMWHDRSDCVENATKFPPFARLWWIAISISTFFQSTRHKSSPFLMIKPFDDNTAPVKLSENSKKSQLKAKPKRFCHNMAVVVKCDFQIGFLFRWPHNPFIHSNIIHFFLAVFFLLCTSKQKINMNEEVFALVLLCK